MSEAIKYRNAAERAIAFNKLSKYCSLPMPPQVSSQFPGLLLDPSTNGHYAAVVSLQQSLGLTADGMLGVSTYNQMNYVYSSHTDYLVVRGVRVPIQTKGQFQVIDFTESPKLDLHKFGHFAKRKSSAVSKVVLHHGGFDVYHLAMVLSTPDRKVSTHIGIGFLEGDPEQIVVAQYLDLNWAAWHCSGHNDDSIGIDFAVQPGAEYAGRYKLPVISNPSTIGPRKVLEFPDRLLQAAITLVEEIHRVSGIQPAMKLAPAADAKLEASTIKSQGITVIGHHHVSTAGKFDCSYIWDRLVSLSTSSPNPPTA